jgi:hypothetical protein
MGMGLERDGKSVGGNEEAEVRAGEGVESLKACVEMWIGS